MRTEKEIRERLFERILCRRVSEEQTNYDHALEMKHKGDELTWVLNDKEEK
jgi:hypothetical protein